MANNLGTAEFPFDQHRLYLAQGGGTFTESIVAPDGVFAETEYYLNCDPRTSNVEALAEALGLEAYGSKAIGKFRWDGANKTYFLNFKRDALSPANAGWNTEEVYQAGIGFPHPSIPDSEYTPPCQPTRYCCGATPKFGFLDGGSPNGEYRPGGALPVNILGEFNYAAVNTASASCAIRLDCASVTVKVETPPTCTRWYATYTPVGLCNETGTNVSGCYSSPACADANCCPGIHVTINILHEGGLTIQPCSYEYNYSTPGWELNTTPFEIESWDNEDNHDPYYTHNRVDGDSEFILPDTGIQVNLSGACKCADYIFLSTDDIPYDRTYPEWVDQFANVFVTVQEYFHGYISAPCTIKPTNVTLRLEISQE